MANRHGLRVPRRVVVRALLCALLALPVLTAPATARPSGEDRARAALDAVSARLLVIRSQIERATPDRRVRLLHEQSLLEAKKRRLTGQADTAAVEAVIARREEARRAAEEAASAPAPQLVAHSIPSSVAVPLVTSAVGGELPAALDGYLASKLSPLTGLGGVFAAESTAVGLDPRLLVAISGAETSFGAYGPAQAIHNPFGMGPHIVYPSWAASIRAAAQNLGGRIYKGDGRYTIATIQQRWAPGGAANDPTNLNANWVRNVGRYFAELGGDPNGMVFTDVSGTPAPAVQVAAEKTSNENPAPLAQGPGVSVPGGGSGVGPQIAQDGLAFLGTPYLWGGELPETGFDCSGFMQYLYGKRGVQLPRVAEDQAAVGIPIPPEGLRAGDAIFFADSSGYIHHEGMYLGGGYFIHAPKTGDVVKISSLYESYYARQYAGARRY
jgi:cell wall-associated NlpC family hydrolase